MSHGLRAWFCLAVSLLLCVGCSHANERAECTSGYILGVQAACLAITAAICRDKTEEDCAALGPCDALTREYESCK